jgi:hypothetical protein
MVIRQSARKQSYDHKIYFAEDQYGCGIVDVDAALKKAGELFFLTSEEDTAFYAKKQYHERTNCQEMISPSFFNEIKRRSIQY